jgi:hypothetical protein
MQSKKLAKAKPGQATQRFLDIAEIREDVVVLKDGTMRAVIMVSSINFALKSEDEQTALIQAYMSFLNGLEYPLQIVIQSRKMNIDIYIESLKKQSRTTENDALRAQIYDYLSFIQELVTLGEIMQKRFFVVVPYDPKRNKAKSFWQRLGSALSPVSRLKLKGKQFDERKEELVRRAQMVIGQLGSMGLEAVPLDTQGLIELYYTVYNPDVFDTEKLEDISKLRVDE